MSEEEKATIGRHDRRDNGRIDRSKERGPN